MTKYAGELALIPPEHTKMNLNRILNQNRQILITVCLMLSRVFWDLIRTLSRGSPESTPSVRFCFLWSGRRAWQKKNDPLRQYSPRILQFQLGSLFAWSTRLTVRKRLYDVLFSPSENSFAFSRSVQVIGSVDHLHSHFECLFEMYRLAYIDLFLTKWKCAEWQKLLSLSLKFAGEGNILTETVHIKP